MEGDWRFIVMIVIRDAKKEDIGEARKLLSVKEIGWEGETYSSAYYWRLINTEGGIFLVAEDGDGVIGTLHGECSVNEDWSYLTGVVVKEECRGKGVGVALIKRFEGIVKDRGVRMVELDANLNTLGRFIHKLGYKKGRVFVNCRKKLK